MLGTSVWLSEAEVHWREFFQSLVERGLHGVQLNVSDDHSGLGAARKAVLPAVPWQRCQFHLQQNAQSYVPQQSLNCEVAHDRRNVFHAADRTEAGRLSKMAADKHREAAPKLAEWIEAIVPEGLAVFRLPVAYRKRLGTTNALKRLNEEIARRKRVASLFPNEAALLRLASAVLAQTDEDWQIGKRYLAMETNS